MPNNAVIGLNKRRTSNMKRGLMIGLLCLSLTACSFGVGAGGGSNGVGIGVGTGVRF